MADLSRAQLTPEHGWAPTGATLEPGDTQSDHGQPQARSSREQPGPRAAAGCSMQDWAQPPIIVVEMRSQSTTFPSLRCLPHIWAGRGPGLQTSTSPLLSGSQVPGSAQPPASPQSPSNREKPPRAGGLWPAQAEPSSYRNAVTEKVSKCPVPEGASSQLPPLPALPMDVLSQGSAGKAGQANTPAVGHGRVPGTGSLIPAVFPALPVSSQEPHCRAG